MLCLSCHKISSDPTLCEYCGSPIPSRQNPPYQSSPVDDLKIWSSQLETQYITVDEFLDNIDQREELYRSVMQDLELLDAEPDDIRREMDEEMRVGRMGIQGLMHALNLLRNWADTMDPLTLNQSLSMAQNSTKMVNKAMQLNWRSFRTIQETAEEFLAQIGSGV